MKLKKAFILLTLIMLCGCWDSTSIEDISMAIGFAVDKGDNGEKLKLSMQVIVPQKINQESNVQDPTSIIETSGHSIHQIFRKTALKSPRIFAQQLRIYLFAQELIKENPFDLVINQFIRDNETRRSSLVFMTPDNPSEILAIDDSGQPASTTIYDAAHNTKTAIGLLAPVSLGDISTYMQNKVSFAIPKIGVDHGKIKIDGASVIKNQRFHTNLSSATIQALNLLTGHVEGGVIEFEHDHHIYSFEIYHFKQQVDIDRTKGGQYTFHVSVNVDGRLSEDWNADGNAFDEQYIQQVEHFVKQHIEKSVSHFIYDLQHNIQADICAFYEKARISYPQAFKKEAAHWDEIFSQSDIHYKVNVKILDFGTKGATQS